MTDSPSRTEPPASRTEPPASRTEPPVTETSAPFWEATREQRLVLQWCRACETVIHYPRAMCPSCLGEDLEWRPSEGLGEIYAVTVLHKSGSPFLQPPYAVALVSLDGGARLMANIVNCAPEQVSVGMPVQVHWEALSDGRHLPLFEPAVGG